ncbi:MAG: flagellar basal body L-ring protein FlgH [Pseudomonadota bacterium]
MMLRFALVTLGALALAGCDRAGHIGQAPAFSPNTGTDEQRAMSVVPLPERLDPTLPGDGASLWSRDRQSLLGDRRASTRGDILTVVIEIDESAEIQNSTERSRSGSEQLNIPQLFGIPQRLSEDLPPGAGIDPAVDLGSRSASEGEGSVQRSEELTLRIAATVVEVLRNGVLRIQGSQEVRVNFEIRELLVTGYVRPEDVSRQNEITYDKIAQARISYGGRGQITDVQQPRYGQQIVDIVLPF